MLVSFSIKLRSWWCLFFFFNLVFYHLKYFLWRKCRKICKKWKALYFRFICVRENSWRAGAKQANWYSEVFGQVSEFDIWWLHFCHAFSLPCLHCQFCLLCHSPTASMLLESPRNPTSWVCTLCFLQSWSWITAGNVWQPDCPICQAWSEAVRLNTCLFKKTDSWYKFLWVQISDYWSLALLKAGMQSSLHEMHMLIVSFLEEKNGFFCMNNLLSQLLWSCTRLAGIYCILS